MKLRMGDTEYYVGLNGLRETRIKIYGQWVNVRR